MQIGANAPTARQDERFERLEIFLTLVDEFLQTLDFIIADLVHARLKKFRRCRQLAADIEKLILNPAQNLVEESMPLAGFEAFFVKHPRQADYRVELVDGAVSVDARRIFGDALAADERGITPIAGARIDFGDANSHGSN